MSPDLKLKGNSPTVLRQNILALWLLALSVTLLPATYVTSRTLGQSQDDGSRQIVLEEFTRARPATSTPQSSARVSRRPPPPTPRTRKPLTYRRAGGPAAIATASSKHPESKEELGITIWRLRPSKQNDSGARLLVMESAKPSQWTPERIEADSPLNVGERVRISVESPRAGYLYVIDREQFADGSLGDAYLIFPTTRTLSGDNTVRPGKLIDIPGQEDDPGFFTLVPSPNRSDQVAEVLTFIVTEQPLENLPITDRPLKVSNSDVAKWEKTWSGEVERFEMVGGAGMTWTKSEQEASSRASARLLTQEEPAPQTIYRVVSKSANALLVTVPLRYGRRP